MKNILTYNEFINEDYRDVAACGSGGVHKDDSITQLANGGGRTIIDVIGYPTGDKQVLGTEEITVKDNDYWDSRRKKVRSTRTPEEILKKRMRKKFNRKMVELDKITENIDVVKYVDWDNLSDDEKMDIIENIYRECEYFQKENWNIWTFREYLDNEIGFKIPMVKLDVKQAVEDAVEIWGSPDNQSRKNLEKIRTYTKLNPIISFEGKFFDGGHRLSVANERGLKTIEAFEISHLINYDWRKFFDENEPLPEIK